MSITLQTFTRTHAPESVTPTPSQVTRAFPPSTLFSLPATGHPPVLSQNSTFNPVRHWYLATQRARSQAPCQFCRPPTAPLEKATTSPSTNLRFETPSTLPWIGYCTQKGPPFIADSPNAFVRVLPRRLLHQHLRPQPQQQQPGRQQWPQQQLLQRRLQRRLRQPPL